MNFDKLMWDLENNKKSNVGCNAKFDMEKFKEYVQTYDPKINGHDNDDTIVKDMIYGIGLCLNEKEFRWAEGFEKFKTFLKAFL